MKQEKVDDRPFYATKTFMGAAGFAIMILLEAAGVTLPYGTVAELLTVWTGYSIADRLRKK